jgi:acetate kinase
MKDLLSKENDDIRATEAVELFCYQTKKWIGAYAAALGGLDTLVFSGGIGENCPVIRSRVCEGLEFLGIELEEKRNLVNAQVVSKENGKTTVRVIRTDEELMIAKTVNQFINLNIETGHDHKNKKNV